MLKRIFWLVAAGVVGWLIWQWLRQRQGEFAHSSPQFAPPRPLEGYTPPTASTPSPAQPAQPAQPVESAPGAPQQAAAGAAIARDSDKTTPAPTPGEAVPERVPGAAEGAAPSEDEEAAGDERDDTADVAAMTAEALTTASENERATAEASNVAVPEGEPLTEEITGYCVRCKTKRPIQGAHEETTESGRRAARGTCPVCGSNMFTFLKENGGGEEAAAGDQS